MAAFKIKTRNSYNINKKPRVYFTCYSDDFDKYFEKICEDIFKTHDCAIYYTEDMNEIIAENEKESDLGRMNLFVVPVTFKLLSKRNRAMNDDIAYAKKEHIPILPIMMESGIDEFYSQLDKFGELQYLNPYSRDLTEISYEEKLKKHLESVLISNEMAERVRAAFDAYIFLSYRKKDRKYANYLMRLIHSNPECRDIAIWFDEFLAPGESFKESIDRILHDSKLFTLLVTPNILEEPDGKPNFVMCEEYPAACKSGIKIFPAEMEETDKNLLADKFKGIPECAKIDDNFSARFVDTISRMAIESNNTPEHNFLIGLAYLEGIDVEVNRNLAIELITKAAEAGLVEAMDKLYLIYVEGDGVLADYQKACEWAQRLVDRNSRDLGEEHCDTVMALNNLAVTCSNLGDFNRALELHKKVCNVNIKALGNEHPDTLISLNNLALTYAELGEYAEALTLFENVYALRCRVLGKEHLDTLQTLSNMAMTHSMLGNYDMAVTMQERACDICCRVFGKEYSKSLTFVDVLARIYVEFGEYSNALKLQGDIYEISAKMLGREHPDTLCFLNNLAVTYGYLKNHSKALECQQIVYNACRNNVGDEHPDTLVALSNLAVTYDNLGNHSEALEYQERAYSLSCKIFGNEHPSTMTMLKNLAITYGELGDRYKEFKLQEQIYYIRCRVIGEAHPDTVSSLRDIAYLAQLLGEGAKALEFYERLYVSYCKIYGSEHPDSVNTLREMVSISNGLGDYIKTISLLEALYNSYLKVFGEEHQYTLTTLNNIAAYYDKLGNLEKAYFFYERLYLICARIFGADDSKTLAFLEALKRIDTKIKRK